MQDKNNSSVYTLMRQHGITSISLYMEGSNDDKEAVELSKVVFHDNAAEHVGKIITSMLHKGYLPHVYEGNSNIISVGENETYQFKNSPSNSDELIMQLNVLAQEDSESLETFLEMLLLNIDLQGDTENTLWDQAVGLCYEEVEKTNPGFEVGSGSSGNVVLNSNTNLVEVEPFSTLFAFKS